MCGLYDAAPTSSALPRIQTHNANAFDDSNLALSYNVAPQSLPPVVQLERETGGREGALSIETA